MDIIDSAKEFAKKNPDKVDQVIDKAGDLIDSKTGNKYADKVDQAQKLAKDKLHGN
ncbi:antitoxin [Corynebacterium hindlerae]|uniref:antitoxin n=1 Tax=Corynebacterium hindlerae TaxID=699041 RepID=UPI001AD6F49E|nr:antitoxin [Corynebacterium hindlerae]QTH59734.1 antitoxin [Corynebacterium hindlerae]